MIKTPWELLKIAQSGNAWPCFCVPFDNFEQVSQITAMCLYPTLSIFYMENVPSLRHCFYKTNIFHVPLSFNLQFFIVLWLQKMCEILKILICNRTSAKEQFFLRKVALSNFDELQLKRSLGYCLEICSQAN